MMVVGPYAEFMPDIDGKVFPKLADHVGSPRLAGHGKLVRYLQYGHLLMAPMGLSRDLLRGNSDDTTNRIHVPGGLQTDGQWLWPAELRFYLEEYGLNLPAEFIRTIEMADGVVAEPSNVQIASILDNTECISLFGRREDAEFFVDRFLAYPLSRSIGRYFFCISLMNNADVLRLHSDLRMGFPSFGTPYEVSITFQRLLEELCESEAKPSPELVGAARAVGQCISDASVDSSDEIRSLISVLDLRAEVAQ